MFFLCAGAAQTFKAKAKAKAKAKIHTITTPKSNVLKTNLKKKPAIKVDLEEDLAGQATKVMLDGKAVLITRKARRDHLAMLQTAQAIH